MKKLSNILVLLATLYSTHLLASETTTVVDVEEAQLTIKKPYVITFKQKEPDEIPTQMQVDLAKHSQSYFETCREKALREDNWSLSLRHTQAKKRQKSKSWPIAKRPLFEQILKEVEAQHSNCRVMMNILLRSAAALYARGDEEVTEEELALTGADLNQYRPEAFDYFGIQFTTARKALETKVNFGNYLRKRKPPTLRVTSSIEDFQRYLTETTHYVIPPEHLESSVQYLKEYIFIE